MTSTAHIHEGRGFHATGTTEEIGVQAAVIVRTATDFGDYLRSTLGRSLPGEGALETAEIMSDPELAASLERALEQARRGEGRPWREVFAELD